jgi:hypothetical protein
MILLKDIFTLLATGEFSNIALDKDRNGNLDESEYEKVIGHLNLALVELYKRFKFQEEEINIHVNMTESIYYLRPEYMVPLGFISTTKYLEKPSDSDGSLNIIEVKDIYDANDEKLSFNNRFATPFIKQKAVDTFKITGLEAAAVYRIVYQAHPPLIILDNDFELDECAINIPRTILDAILYYIATRIYRPIGANNSTANADKGDNYQQQYELACQKIDLYGLDIQFDDEPDNYERDGWA